MVEGSNALVYLIGLVAGVYGVFRPTGQVYDLYGQAGNLTILIVMVVGGSLGLWAYLFKRLRLELLGAPLLFTGVIFVAPALFYAEIARGQPAWYGWLCIAFAASLVSRWADVRNLLDIRGAVYRSRHRVGRGEGQ